VRGGFEKEKKKSEARKGKGRKPELGEKAKKVCASPVTSRCRRFWEGQKTKQYHETAIKQLSELENNDGRSQKEEGGFVRRPRKSENLERSPFN